MVTLRSRREQPERDPMIEGWLAWYWILPGKSGEESVLVGNGGFKGPPTPNGVAEIGYYLRPTHRGRGYGIEAVRCLLEHVPSHAGVRLVMAETRRHNIASIRLLQKVGLCARAKTLSQVYFALSLYVDLSVARTRKWPEHAPAIVSASNHGGKPATPTKK